MTRAHLEGLEEEKLDQWLFRPLSHPVAVAAAKLGLTPNQVSVIGMLLGVAGAYFFQFREAALVWPGVLLFCGRNILDYADGQLARLTGKGSPLGYFFDGLCDYVAYAAVYGFAIYGIWPDLGVWALVLGLAAGVSGGVQSAVLDFFKREYRYWALGSDNDRYESPEELRIRRDAATGLDRMLLGLAIDYARRQRLVCGWRLALREPWSKHRALPEFYEAYSQASRWPLKLYFLAGPNWHAYGMFVFGLMGRMEWFFWVQLVGMNALLAMALLWQRVLDRRLANAVAG